MDILATGARAVDYNQMVEQSLDRAWERGAQAADDELRAQLDAMTKRAEAAEDAHVRVTNAYDQATDRLESIRRKLAENDYTDYNRNLLLLLLDGIGRMARTEEPDQCHCPSCEAAATLDAYQRQAMATRNDGTDLIYAAGKLTVEAAELQQHVLKNAYHGRPLSLNDVEEELGDVLWYVAAVADYLGMSLSQVAAANLAKLQARHGTSYNPAHYAEAG